MDKAFRIKIGGQRTRCEIGLIAVIKVDYICGYCRICEIIGNGNTVNFKIGPISSIISKITDINIGIIAGEIFPIYICGVADGNGSANGPVAVSISNNWFEFSESLCVIRVLFRQSNPEVSLIAVFKLVSRINSWVWHKNDAIKNTKINLMDFITALDLK